MGSTANDIECVVMGTLLNDNGGDGFMSSCRMSLKKELFADRRNAFVFGIMEKMYSDGLKSFLPTDIYDYACKNSIQYGNASKFLSYMCSLATEHYRPFEFKANLRELVKLYIRRVNYVK